MSFTRTAPDVALGLVWSSVAARQGSMRPLATGPFNATLPQLLARANYPPTSVFYPPAGQHFMHGLLHMDGLGRCRAASCLAPRRRCGNANFAGNLQSSRLDLITAITEKSGHWILISNDFLFGRWRVYFQSVLRAGSGQLIK